MAETAIPGLSLHSKYVGTNWVKGIVNQTLKNNVLRKQFYMNVLMGKSEAFSTSLSRWLITQVKREDRLIVGLSCENIFLTFDT